ncbi:hypothetical protein B0H14DRAFT_2564194 [Mycena olivaceomarginata]|nr:hypothetical protein B0H14DRAFT_2564194 [Mycena olivaceomarginata]
MPSFSSFSHLAQVLLLATVHRVAERRDCVAETSELTPGGPHKEHELDGQAPKFTCYIREFSRRNLSCQCQTDRGFKDDTDLLFNKITLTEWLTGVPNILLQFLEFFSEFGSVNLVLSASAINFANSGK